VPAATLGLTMALAFWILGQNLGQVYSGHATDPNSGPLLALMAIALVGVERQRRLPRMGGEHRR
jgi:hypothetical protein